MFLLNFAHLGTLLEILTHLIMFVNIKARRLSYHEIVKWVLDRLTGTELSNILLSITKVKTQLML